MILSVAVVGCWMQLLMPTSPADYSSALDSWAWAVAFNLDLCGMAYAILRMWSAVSSVLPVPVLFWVMLLFGIAASDVGGAVKPFYAAVTVLPLVFDTLTLLLIFAEAAPCCPYCPAADFSMLVPMLNFLVAVSSSVAVEDDHKVMLKAHGWLEDPLGRNADELLSCFLLLLCLLKIFHADVFSCCWLGLSWMWMLDILIPIWCLGCMDVGRQCDEEAG
ncbi:hypothetical protein Nepgr_020369 [Nepenthes gracilis]|uniref:Uncharacterized protein n=1 Tax=Nepenthes gracilis TaxID=150966 RepID=A0AAD3SUY2_NEPGR|nr:hypothetical protein Nepgr_020369 [Nepenthes gracilis]